PDGWAITTVGRQTMERGEYPRIVQERRSFYFLAGEKSNSPPTFLKLTEPLTVPWQSGDDWHFDVRILESCIARNEDWKKRHGFPLDVQRLLGHSMSATSSPSWQEIVVYRPE